MGLDFLGRLFLTIPASDSETLFSVTPVNLQEVSLDSSVVDVVTLVVPQEGLMMNDLGYQAGRSSPLQDASCWINLRLMYTFNSGNDVFNWTEKFDRSHMKIRLSREKCITSYK